MAVRGIFIQSLVVPGTSRMPQTVASLRKRRCRIVFITAHTCSTQCSAHIPFSTDIICSGPFSNSNPSSTNVQPSLVDLRRKLVKFVLGDEGHSTTINVEDCVGGVEVLDKALKKFGKLGPKNTDLEGLDRAGTNDGGLAVDGWCVFLDRGNEASQGRSLTEAQLLRVCHAPPNDPARERGLTLRRVSKVRRPKPIDYGASPQAQATSPTGLAFPSGPSDHESDDLTKLGTTRASQIPAL